MDIENIALEHFAFMTNMELEEAKKLECFLFQCEEDRYAAIYKIFRDNGIKVDVTQENGKLYLKVFSPSDILSAMIFKDFRTQSEDLDLLFD